MKKNVPYLYKKLGKKIIDNCNGNNLKISDLKKTIQSTRITNKDVKKVLKELENMKLIKIDKFGKIESRTKVKINTKTMK